MGADARPDLYRGKAPHCGASFLQTIAADRLLPILRGRLGWGPTVAAHFAEVRLLQPDYRDRPPPPQPSPLHGQGVATPTSRSTPAPTAPAARRPCSRRRSAPPTPVPRTCWRLRSRSPYRSRGTTACRCPATAG